MNTETQSTSTANLPPAPSRQVRRQNERRQIKNLRRHQNETVLRKNQKRGLYP